MNLKHTTKILQNPEIVNKLDNYAEGGQSETLIEFDFTCTHTKCKNAETTTKRHQEQAIYRITTEDLHWNGQ